MLFGTLFTGEIAKSALVAYVHYLGIILCFGSLLFERLTLKVGLNRNETISMIIAVSYTHLTLPTICSV